MLQVLHAGNLLCKGGFFMRAGFRSPLLRRLSLVHAFFIPCFLHSLLSSMLSYLYLLHLVQTQGEMVKPPMVVCLGPIMPAMKTWVTLGIPRTLGVVNCWGFVLGVPLCQLLLETASFVAWESVVKSLMNPAALRSSVTTVSKVQHFAIRSSDSPEMWCL